MSAHVVWTKERVKKVRRLAAVGYSASQIALRFYGDETRNSIIGICHRAGIQLRGSRAGRPLTDAHKAALKASWARRKAAA